MAKERVLIDTMIIIEGHRTRCWKPLVHSYSVETGQECFDETQRGDVAEPGYVTIDGTELSSQIVVHQLLKASTG